MDEEPISFFLEGMACTNEGFGRGPLQKCPRLRVHWRAQEVVAAGITDIELDGGVQLNQFHQFRFAKVAGLMRRLRSQSLFLQLRNWMERRNAKSGIRGLGR